MRDKSKWGSVGQVIPPPRLGDALSAVFDHLVGDLDEECCHALVGAVVARDRQHHLHVVHESRKGVDDGCWGSVVKRLREFLQSAEVFDVVL